MRPETLIILTPGFPENEADSSCLPTPALLVKQLQENSPALKIIVIAFQYPFTARTYEWNGCRVIAMGGKGRAKLFRLLLWQKVWATLNQLNKKYTIIGLLSYWCGEAALIGNRYGKKHNVPHYSWLLGQDAKKENHYVRRIKPGSSELIAISDFVQSEFQKNHAILPKHVIPIGIDLREFPAENMIRDIDLLAAGSLIPLKRYELFLDVVSRIKTSLPFVKGQLCGKGPEADKLKRLIMERQLQMNIKLEGELPHSEILLYMKRARVFLHTSVYEGFSAVCLEALYAGTPVISFCKPMNEDIPNWHIVNSVEEMAAKALEVLDDRDLENNTGLPFPMKDSAKKILQLFGH